MTNNTINLTDDATALALVDTIKAATNGLGKYAAYVEAHNVTKDTVKDHALALAILAYPNLKPVQTEKVDGVKVRTKFGNAVQAAGAGLRNALPEQPSTSSTDWLAKIVKDADGAIGDGVDAEQVLAVVTEWATGVLS